ncbi:MAG TPA: hypothetical protein VFN61_16475 [Acidimicrobiales bacterium]|nr:hypothetical protein [Acidimicrobiales bacterium]
MRPEPTRPFYLTGPYCRRDAGSKRAPLLGQPGGTPGDDAPAWYLRTVFRSPLTLEIDCPRRVEAGEDVLVVVRPVLRRPVEIVRAEVRWVCRWARRVRYRRYQLGPKIGAYTQTSKQTVKSVVSASPLALAGEFPSGPLAPRQARFETLDTPPSTSDPAGLGWVLSQVVVELELRSGKKVIARKGIWVRPPAKPRDGLGGLFAGADAGTLASGGAPAPVGAAHLSVLSADGSPWLHCETCRPLEGQFVLCTGSEGTGPGRVSLSLASQAQWEVHYMAPVKDVSRGPRRRARQQQRRQFEEVWMERQLLSRTAKLGHVDVPELPAQSVHTGTFCFDGPRGTKQTTSTPEGFTQYQLVASWQAGTLQAEASAPVVVALGHAQQATGRGFSLFGRRAQKG